MNLFEDAVIVFILNLPFGYWRANVKKFSFQWILAVHIPVPFVIVLRLISGLGFGFITYPILVGVFFFGQYLGGKFLHWRENNHLLPITSCLVWDMVKAAESSLKRLR
ncbi:MAG: hypothetical protein A2V66_16165 [Ignavibacteria bacterium RBG_13_36_8]|nr:MAG: hypothetical protein A2V66_16165 [Ignavibacteria bacterium RBG_13_36_8]